MTDLRLTDPAPDLDAATENRTLRPERANGHVSQGEPLNGGNIAAPPVASGVGDDSAEAPADEGPGSLGARFFRPQTLISFAIAVAILIFFFRRLDINPGAVWRNARQANLLLYALAFASFYLSFILRALRWRRMLARVGIDDAHGYPMPKTGGMIQIFLLSWFANCIVPAKLGDAYRSYLLKQETKASFSTTLGTIFAERLTDLVVLFAALSTTGLIVFGRDMPGEARQTFIIGSALVGVAAIGLGVMWRARNLLDRLLPERLRKQYARLHDAIFTCLKRPTGFLAISVVIWAAEGARVWLVARSLGVELGIAVAIFVALMSSLLTTLPITPAGLGVVEGAMIVLLKWFGVEDSMAGAITLLDRVIGYWSIVVVGTLLYVHRLRRDVSGA